MERVILEDHSLRDGLQFESRIFTLEEKLSIFRLLAASGFQKIQVASFVSSRLIPHMADSEALVRAVLSESWGVAVSALVLNARGLERAPMRFAPPEPFFVRLRRPQPQQRRLLRRGGLHGDGVDGPGGARRGFLRAGGNPVVPSVAWRGRRSPRSGWCPWLGSLPPPAPERSASPKPPDWPNPFRCAG